MNIKYNTIFKRHQNLIEICFPQKLTFERYLRIAVILGNIFYLKNFFFKKKLGVS